MTESNGVKAILAGLTAICLLGAVAGASCSQTPRARRVQLLLVAVAVVAFSALAILTGQ
jgi:hypothetical protein